MLPLRNGDEGVLGINALRKLVRFVFNIRDQVRLIRNRQVCVLLCHLGTFVRLEYDFTADAADPLGALEPFELCFLANAEGNITAFFTRCSSTAGRVIAVSYWNSVSCPSSCLLFQLARFPLVSNPR